MSYRVILARPAVRELRRVPSPYHDAIVRALRGLETEPRPAGCKKLSGATDLYRIRVGVYRMLYEITDRIKLVSVERIAHRREAYR